MNVSLRAVHEGLQGNGPIADRWCSFMGRLVASSKDTPIPEETLLRALRSEGLSGSANEWCTNLRNLGVIGFDGRLSRERSDHVRIALDLVGDCFVAMASRSTWAAVATLPEQVHSLLRPPPLRQTAGVMLELIDRATKVVRLAAPFVDAQAVAFLSDSLTTARYRGADVTVITSAGRGVEFVALDRSPMAGGSGGLAVTEVRTELSSLGSHAKVLLVDDEHGYVGSANLTAAGFGRHVEIGVEASGPQAEDLARLLVALERLGVRVMSVPRA